MTGQRILVITNDFPPRPGGIQSFVHGLVSRLPADDVVVFTSRWRDWRRWDATQPFEIVRAKTSVLLPSPAVRREAVARMRADGCTSVWFGATAPLGLLAPALRRAGAERIVATTHGHEVGWAAVPAARNALRRIAGSVDVLTYLGDYTRSRLAVAIGPNASKLHQLSPGVDVTQFRPGLGHELRAELGLTGKRVVVCVSRLMPRKGQDVLIRALPRMQRTVPGTALLLVGGGPSRDRLEALAKEHGVEGSVVFTGSVPWSHLPSYFCAGDVFAMPCRTRLRGLDVEGLGIVFLEAAACGLAVVAGDSGGATDAVRDGETGYVVDGRSTDAVVDRLVTLLRDPELSARMGQRGREWVSRDWTWERSAARLQQFLTPG